ncbi:MAG: 50S ribosomal protein L25 [Anaerolineales bacterium]|nr:50S ribosomal protein L25 [Anaerolineales bacterium]MCB8952659.1 50S ribosomal protein L25 [Ardenticatenales bacterium]
MSEQFMIDAQPRAVVGKKVKQLRREGIIPAVIYGQDSVTNIQVNDLEVRRVLRKAGSNDLINVNVDGAQRTTLVREVQKHAVRGDLLHIDFLEVNMRETLTTEVALMMTGTAKPVKDGLGLVTQMLHTMEIECLPDALVSEIEFDAGMIATPDDFIHVRDLPRPKGVTFLADPDTLVATFEYSQAEAEEGAEAETSFLPAADMVEVIKKGKVEDEF